MDFRNLLLQFAKAVIYMITLCLGSANKLVSARIRISFLPCYAIFHALPMTLQKQSSIAKTTEARVEECNPIFFMFFVCDPALLLIVLIMA